MVRSIEDDVVVLGLAANGRVFAGLRDNYTDHQFAKCV